MPRVFSTAIPTFSTRCWSRSLTRRISMKRSSDLNLLGTVVSLIVLCAAYLLINTTEKVNSFPPTKNSSPVTPVSTQKTRVSFYSEEDLIFPDNFLFGTAYSDFQTAGLGPKSDWSVNWNRIKEITEEDFRKKGTPREGIHPGIANDLYNRY